MKKQISVLVLTAVCVVLAGCGVKGALYYPQTEQVADVKTQGKAVPADVK